MLGARPKALHFHRKRKTKNPLLSLTAPSAPGSVKFSELTTTSVNVSWDAPQFPNGPLEGYRLVYEPCTPVDGKWGSLTWSELFPFKGWFASRDHTMITSQQLDVVRVFLSYKWGD